MRFVLPLATLFAAVTFGLSAPLSAQLPGREIVEQPPAKDREPKIIRAIGADDYLSFEGVPVNFDNGDEVRFGTYRANENHLLEINIQKGPVVASSALADWWSAIWIVEKLGRYYRLRSKWQDCYLHIERGRLECGAASGDWWSAQWQIFSATSDAAHIKNRWKNCHLNIIPGPLSCSKIRATDNFELAHWKWDIVQRGTPDVAETVRQLNSSGCPVAAYSSDSPSVADKLCLIIRDYPNLPADWNDDIERIEIPLSEIVVRLYEHDNFQGRSVTIFCGINELIDEPENEISSIRIYYDPKANQNCNSVNYSEHYYWNF